MIDRLSNGDITKHEKIYEMPYTYCLLQMAYWHDLDDLNRQNFKRDQLRNKR